MSLKPEMVSHVSMVLREAAPRTLALAFSVGVASCSSLDEELLEAARKELEAARKARRAGQ